MTTQGTGLTTVEIVGSVLASGVAVLAILRGILEVYDRFSKRRIAVERGLASAEHIGNHVTIVNLSDKPLLISAWDIVWARRGFWGRKVTIGAADGDDDSYGLAIAPHDQRRFDFVDEHHFDWGAKMRERYGSLYFRLWIAGSQRAKWFRLI